MALGFFAYPKLRQRAATKMNGTETMNILNPVLDTRQSSNLRHIFHAVGQDHNGVNFLAFCKSQGLSWAVSGSTICF